MVNHTFVAKKTAQLLRVQWRSDVHPWPAKREQAITCGRGRLEWTNNQRNGVPIGRYICRSIHICRDRYVCISIFVLICRSIHATQIALYFCVSICKFICRDLSADRYTYAKIDTQTYRGILSADCRSVHICRDWSLHCCVSICMLICIDRYLYICRSLRRQINLCIDLQIDTSTADGSVFLSTDLQIDPQRSISAGQYTSAEIDTAHISVLSADICTTDRSLYFCVLIRTLICRDWYLQISADQYLLCIILHIDLQRPIYLQIIWFR